MTDNDRQTDRINFQAEKGVVMTMSSASGIMVGTTNRNAPGEIGVSRGLTWKVVAPMQHHSIPHTTEETTEDVVRIPVHSKKYPGLFALVSSYDAPTVQGFRWRALEGDTTLYAFTRIGSSSTGRTVFMHRLILGVDDRSLHVDHRDHNGLNNVRSNIRIATPRQNSYNQRSQTGSSSRFKGVSFVKRRERWTVYIRIDGKNTFLGYFRDEEEAARAYDAAAREHHGEFAFLNFPEEVER